MGQITNTPLDNRGRWTRTCYPYCMISPIRGNRTGFRVQVPPRTRPFRTCLTDSGPYGHYPLVWLVRQLHVEACVDLGLVLGGRVAKCLHEVADGVDRGGYLLFGHPGRVRAGAAGGCPQAGAGGQLAGLGLGDPLADDGGVGPGVERGAVLISL